jgi:hypothetical protein
MKLNIKILLGLLLFIPSLLIGQVADSKSDVSNLAKDTIVHEGNIDSGVINLGKVYVNGILAPTTNLVAYWNSSYGIRPEDSTIILINTSYQSVDTIKLSGVDWDITNKNLGIPLKTSATFKFLSDIPGDTSCFGDNVKLSIYPTTLFQNPDFDSTKYFKKANHVLNADSTELYPARITEIALYSQASDAMAYFNVPNRPVNGIREVGIGKTYATITAALAASQDNDTILIYSGTYVENVTLATNVHLQGVGNVVQYGVGTYCLIFNIASKNNNISNIAIKGFAGAAPLFINSRTNGTVNINNCFINRVTAANIVSATGTTPPIFNFSKSVIMGHIASNVNNIVDQTYVNNSTVSGSGFSFAGNSPIFTYCKLKKMQTATSYGFFAPSAAFTKLTVYGCTWEDNLINTATLTTAGKIVLRRSSGTKIGIKDIIVTGGRKNLTWDISYTSFSGGSIYLLNQKQITLDHCTLTNIPITQIETVSVNYTATFSNNTCSSLDDAYLSFKRYGGSINNNSFISDSSYFLLCSSTTNDNNVVNIYNNLFEYKNLSTQNYQVMLGNEFVASTYDTINYFNNKNILPGYYGRQVGSIHAIFVGNQRTNLYRNNVIGSFLGIVSKTSGIRFGNKFHHNLMVDCAGFICLRGAPKWYIYNNTLVKNKTVASYFISADDNGGVVPSNKASDSCTVKNNIFVNNDAVSNNYFFTFQTYADSSNEGWISDHNILYSLVSNNYHVNRYPDLTFTTWQLAGYDANSTNTNPGLISTTQLWPLNIINGENLGEDYNIGLNISTVWPSSIVTKQQPATWQIGAYIK